MITTILLSILWLIIGFRLFYWRITKHENQTLPHGLALCLLLLGGPGIWIMTLLVCLSPRTTVRNTN